MTGAVTAPGPADPWPWDAEALWKRLEPLLPGLTVEVLAHCDSTNSVLLERARVDVGRAVQAAEAAAGGDLAQVRRSRESAAFGRRAADVQPCLLVAEHQSQGRGRLGRTWTASPGASLTFSLSVPMASGLHDWSGLSLAVGVALAEALDPRGGAGSTARGPRIGLKWPNDLWLMDDALGTPSATPQGRKLGGVLIESCAAGASRLAVIGVGLNILPQPAVGLTHGRACWQELDGAATAPLALSRVAPALVQALLDFQRSGFAPFAAGYAARDLLAGQAVTTTEAGVPEGTARGVSADGALQVVDAHGVRHAVHGGEVSVRLQSRTTPVWSSGGTAC